MIKLPGTPDGEYTYHGTDYHLRCYIDPSGTHAPLFLVHEPNDNRGPSLNQTRVDLAVHLSARLDLTPDRVNWVEQERDGTLTTFEFRPFIQEIRSYAQDLPRAEMEEAERSGLLKPERITRYNAFAHKIPQDPLEALVGEPLRVPESRADRQNGDFERLHDPSKWRMPERSEL